MKNRLTYRFIPSTPFEAYTTNKHNLSHLQIFGSYVTSKNPRDRATKLAHNVSHGIFFGFTAADRNLIFRDDISNQVKRARPIIFDESHYHRSKRPPYAQQLYNLGELSTPSTSKCIQPTTTPTDTVPKSRLSGTEDPYPSFDTTLSITENTESNKEDPNPPSENTLGTTQNIESNEAIEVTLIKPIPLTSQPPPTKAPHVIPIDIQTNNITTLLELLLSQIDGIDGLAEESNIHTAQ